MAGTSLVFFSPISASWQQFPLPEPQQGLTISIGRSADNALVINDPSVSSRHALLLVDPQGYCVLDQNSSNGTALNGQFIPPNEWVYIPPGSTFSIGNTTFHIESELNEPVPPPPPQQVYQPQMMPPAMQPAKRRSALPFVLAGIALFIIVAGGLILLIKLTGSSGGSMVRGNPSFTQQSLTLNADGSTQTDKNGVAISLPAGAVTEGSVQLTSADLPKELAQELSQGYKLISPAYSLTAQGAMDGIQSGQLAFPARDNELRLMAVIDGIYAAELNITPENGVLTLPADVHPSDLGTLANTGGMWQSGTIQYILVQPKPGSQGSLVTSRKLAAPARQTTPDRCFSLTRTRCWQNGNGSIQLMMDKDISLTPAQSNTVINYIQSNMDKYENLGFTGAIYTNSNPVQVVVTKGAGTPSYVVSNGVIYLPNDIASKIAGGGKDDFLNHEMAHWIQDENYNLTSAYFFGADTWWIETSAENMVMLIDSTYVSANLLAYGEIDADEKHSVLQSSPYQWPMSEFYVQSQLVKVNICPGNCPLTQQSFVAAINNGTYPYTDDGAKSKLHANLADYARYLLGVAPLTANTSIPLDGVLTGASYGDHIVVKRTTRSEFDVKDFVGYGRITAEEKDNIPGMLIHADLQKDGVYVLRIDLGTGEMSPQWPAMLRIEPGAPFYYRLNDGEVLFNDGKSELIIQPIKAGTAGNEITKVRLAAVGLQGGEIFKAHLSVVDLSGMWMINLPDESAYINNLTCSSADDAEFIGRTNVPITVMFMMFGDFTPDPASLSLTWNANLERAASMLAPLGSSGSDYHSDSTFNATAFFEKGIIHLDGTNYQAEDTTFDLTDEGKYFQEYISSPGTFQFSGEFDQLTYIGKESSDVPAGLPNQLVWELSGGNIIFNMDCDFLDQHVSETGDLEEENRNHCTGVVEVPATVSIYQPKK